MHVLFLPSWYPRDPADIGGSFFREQAIALAGQGVKVGVLACTLRSARRPREFVFGRRAPWAENDEGVITWRASTAHLTPRFPTLSAMNHAALLARTYAAYARNEGHPDVIHIQSALPAGMGAIRIAARHSIPVVLTEHSTAFARNRVSGRSLAGARLVAHRAAARFAVSTPFARLLEKQLGFAAGGFAVMPNAVDDRFLAGELVSRSDIQGFRFAHVSLLDEKKDVATALRAFAMAFSAQPDVTLAIGGDGPTRPALMAQARELGIDRQVEFAGALSRQGVRDLLGRSDAFVLPSRYETFGVVLIEALACGLPLVATRCGGPEDVVSPECGILVEPGDTAAMANAMRSLRENAAAVDRAALRNLARERYGASAIARRWIGIYERILREHAPADRKS